VQQGLTQDDFDMYYETWEKFDEAATQYIPLSALSEFVDALEEPLRLPAPNLYKLVSLNIPICENERVHCVDILDALTKNFLGTVGDTSGELGDIKKGPDRIDYNPVTTTLERQREMFVARLIQRTWRNFVKRRHAAALMALADESSAEEELSVAGWDLGEELTVAEGVAKGVAKGVVEEEELSVAGSSRRSSASRAVGGWPVVVVPELDTGRPSSRLSHRSGVSSTRSSRQHLHDDDDDVGQ